MRFRSFALFLALCLYAGCLCASHDSARLHADPLGGGAECRDGTYSSATGSGACSHHGGVKRWLSGASTATSRSSAPNLATPQVSTPRLSVPRFSTPARSGTMGTPPASNPSAPSAPRFNFHVQPGAPTYVPNGFYYDSATNSFVKGQFPGPAGQRLKPAARPVSRTGKSASRAQRQSQRSVALRASWSGKCVGVADGDTLTVMYGRTPVRIRLYGVDCPEKAQPFGTQAKAYTSRFAFGQMVKIYSKGSDRYGRTLGWVFRGTACLNAALARDGYAWWYRQYAPGEAKLASLEQQAKAARRGLWRDVHAMAPWTWRRTHS